MQVSMRIACPFCIDMNSYEFEKYDITQKEISVLKGEISIKEVSTFSYKEKLIFYYIKGLVRTPIKQNPKVIEKMKQVFTEKEFASITVTVAQVDYWTRVIQGFGIQPAGFMDNCKT
jgi:hypothetical protein